MFPASTMALWKERRRGDQQRNGTKHEESHADGERCRDQKRETKARRARSHSCPGSRIDFTVYKVPGNDE